MADRIFKGRLITTGDIHDENVRAFPEASEDFRKEHKGGLHPFHMIYDILQHIETHGIRHIEDMRQQRLVREINGSIWLSGKDSWIKIDPDGSFEIGISGV